MTVSINNVLLIDGSGQLPFKGSLLIRDDKIEDILPVEETVIPAGTVIDGKGFVCTPGFIDIHRHADYAVFRDDFGYNELSQGLTTIINGNCGMSGAPVFLDNEISRYQESVIGKAVSAIPTDSVRGYCEALRTIRPALNSGILAGLGTIAALENGISGAFQAETVTRIRRDLEKALAEGAIGVSLGMGYMPLFLYSKEEILSCLEPIRNSSVPVTVHMRQEGDGMLTALQETISIAKELNAPFEISHLKAIGKRSWQKVMPQALTILHRALEEGVQLGWDIYPYTAGSTQLAHVLPPEVWGKEKLILNDPELYANTEKRIMTGTDFENPIRLCGFENIYPGYLYDMQFRDYNNLSILEGAKKAGMEPLRWLLTILSIEKSPSMIDFITCEEDIMTALKDKGTAVISDSIYPADGSFHPRVAGTFSRIIERYVLKTGTLSLPEAVRKMTYLPAKRMGIKDRGLLKKGFKADLCVFDPRKIKTKADYGKELIHSEGMEYVLINGAVCLHKEKFTEHHAGKCL